MTAKYSAPSVEAIQEDCEDDFKGQTRSKDVDFSTKTYFRHLRSSTDAMIVPGKTNTGRERERRRSHRSGIGSKHSKTKGRDRDVTRAAERMENEQPRVRHRRVQSNRSSASISSSSEDEGEPEDHREVLAQARARLTSPSMLSTITARTTSTNKSSGSSGSNSTVTQASITKRSLGKRPDIPEASRSPAVPDAPNVFAYLDNGSTTSLVEGDEEGKEEEVEKRDEEHDGNGENEEQDATQQDSHWPSHEYATSLTHTSPDHGSASSSGSSSFHGSDHFSDPVVDNDTDRSTSPERSAKDHTSDREHELPTDPASTKIASQIAAARQRQIHHANGAFQSFSTPTIARGTAVHPYTSQGSTLSSRHAQHMNQRRILPAENVPVNGYGILASRLSHGNAESDEGAKIKPMYRKFEALNHRLLLHLQDELSELEEHLHRLDRAEAHSNATGLNGSVVPASRRAAQASGGELQWHKTDVLGRIGFKLAQYNQALAAFNTTQALHPPNPEDVSAYRSYLSSENPIVEPETHFLDPTDDLVSVSSERVPRFSSDINSSYANSIEPETPSRPASSASEPPSLSSLALAIAVAVLVPILTFTVIPGFVGRMTVVGLVAGGVVTALMQSRAVGVAMLGRDSLVCGGVYGGVMIVVAGIMA